MPSLLSALHELVPSEVNGFFWADRTGHLAGFVPEYVIPEVVAALVDNFGSLVERALPVNFATTMLRGNPLGNLLPVFTPEFYRGDVYNLIYRPYRLHHSIDLVVRDTPDGVGMGAFVVGRSIRQPQFGAAEKDTLLQLLPYIAHAMHGRPATSGRDDEFADSGDSGMAILDQRGHVATSASGHGKFSTLPRNPIRRACRCSTAPRAARHRCAPCSTTWFASRSSAMHPPQARCAHA